MVSTRATTVIRRPSVRMIRQPPEQEPADSAPADSRITHQGTADDRGG
jgi:hypothetical protein